MGNKYFLYCRKSSESAERQALSIESQRKEALKSFGNLNIVDILEESASAFEPYNRPVFAKMMERLQKGEANCIIAWHPDRLSRNSLDAGQLIHFLDRGFIADLKFVSYAFTNTPEGKFMLSIALSGAKYQSDTLSNNVKRGNLTKLEKGGWPRLPPQGYMNDTVDKTIVVDKVRFPLIRKAWDMLLLGSYTVTEILGKLNREWGYTTKNGKTLAASTLHKIFSNQFYYGLMVSAEGTFKGNYKTMITEEEYWRAQEIMGKKCKPRPKSYNFYTRGIITCGECGRPTTTEFKKKVNKGDGRIHNYEYIRCTKSRIDIKCSQPYLEMKVFEGQVEKTLHEISIPQSFLKWTLNYLKDNAQEKEDKTTIQKNLQKALTAANQELSGVMQMRARNLISDDDFIAHRDKLKAEAARIKESLFKVEHPEDDLNKLTEKTFNLAHYAIYWFKNGTDEDKKVILNSIASNLSLKNRELRIDLRKPFLSIKKSKKFLPEENNKFEPQVNAGLSTEKKSFHAQNSIWPG